MPLGGGTGEAGAKELALDEADEAAFHTILAYLYTGKASVASDRVHNVRPYTSHTRHTAHDRACSDMGVC